MGELIYGPHLSVEATGPEGERVWRCTRCGSEGDDIDEMMNEPARCSVPVDPCKWCGQAPLCAPDCVGMAMILSGVNPETMADDVYVIGQDDLDG